VGLSTFSPSAKIEVYADNETSLHIKSTSGTEIVRIENGLNDTTPFLIDENGSVGINTENLIAPLDVVGNIALNGELRLYGSNNRTNYIGLSAPSVNQNYRFTLPGSFGQSGQALITNGSGGLSWGSFTVGNLVTSGVGVNITYNGQNATIRNTGVLKINGGSGISVTPSEGTGEVTVSDVVDSSPYPFTTPGFSLII
jgi:hypothetical protein